MTDFSLPRITEKRYYKIPPQAFTANGTADGVVTIASTYAFKVGQTVVLRSNVIEKQAKIKRIISTTQLIVIAPSEPVTTTNKFNISDFLVSDAATIAISEILRPVIDILEIQRHIYEEEPTVALRSHSVDWLGRSYSETNPMPVADLSSSNTLLDIFNTLEDGVLSIGTDDGSVSGNQFVFVNNRRLQILAAKDRVQSITYADFGTKDERVTQVDYTAPSIGVGVGFTARKSITYTLISGKYRRDSISWSLV